MCHTPVYEKYGLPISIILGQHTPFAFRKVCFAIENRKIRIDEAHNDAAPYWNPVWGGIIVKF